MNLIQKQVTNHGTRGGKTFQNLKNLSKPSENAMGAIFFSTCGLVRHITVPARRPVHEEYYLILLNYWREKMIIHKYCKQLMRYR